MKQFYLAGLLLSFWALPSAAQVNFTANTPGSVPVYTSNFFFGSNMGNYTQWTNQTIADIAAGNTALNVKGAGVKSLHLPLPEDFLETWGYTVSVNDFIHYGALGIKDNAVFLEFPSPAHKDHTIYPSCTNESLIWSNLYEPIWDNGNGTPVNENNYFALYVYNTVSIYKNYVKFWEVVNEPDYDGGLNGWKSPGQGGNWWDSNPTPCELVRLQAPIFNYIRMMRIAYEVIKSIDPSAYVAMGGTGYPSFLDAMLRNTDNSIDGSITSDYPVTGGAYFDCNSFHYYPMYDLRYVDGSGNIIPLRHSDNAVDQFISRKKTLDSVLALHGYNDVTYPKKVFINTENNIPRVSIGGYIGSDDAQRNYDMKAAVACQLNDIRQWYLFTIGDSKTDGDASNNSFDFVGLYKNLNNIGPTAMDPTYRQQYNPSGIAYKTLSDVLNGFSADLDRTALMNLPAGVRGGAFKNPVGDYRYILWATTTTDNSEAASATYAFPAAANVPAQLYQLAWDFTQTNDTALVSSQNIALTGSPVIIFAPLVVTALRPDTVRNNSTAYFSFTLYPNPVTNRLTIKLHLLQRQVVSIKIMDAMGQLMMNVADNTMYSEGNNTISIPISSNLTAGIYYCHMLAGGNREQTVKFIVTK